MKLLRSVILALRRSVGIDLPCPNCSTLLTAWERRELGVCGACVAATILEPHRPKYLRLIAKRRRYAAAGVRTASIDGQLVREIVRMQHRVSDIRPELEPALKRVVTGWFAPAA